eukprot:gnl/Dysnectes_brevis/5534_a7997_553.p1 GENE.gnl/Dysnectes_brevis/5534_a7997_553~~gnl/Dysnectes_brevis/5534_a7997_553.p1  ORF type:complete len:1339 (-),score=292.52 gnl/Dysnectes_brevis/5534_a7997_553:107-3790(-)
MEKHASLTVFDRVEDVITAVGIVKPRSDVFVDDIKFLLVLCTRQSVHLLGATFSNPTNPMSILTLLETGLVSPADPTEVTRVIGTENGRIFLLGQDGHVHELSYAGESMLSFRKCKRKNKTKSLLFGSLPVIGQLLAKSPVQDAVQDTSRNVMYMLHKNGAITCIWMGEDGTGFKVLPTYNSLGQDLKVHGPVMDADKVLVSLVPVSASESQTLHLQALSALGTRMFFSLTPQMVASAQVDPLDSSFSHFHPKTLVLKHVITADEAEASAQYSLGISESGVTLQVITTTSEGSSSLVSRAREQGAGSAPVGASESSETFPVDGRVVALAEMPQTMFFSVARPIIVPPPSHLTSSPLNWQHALPPRRFFALTPNGVHPILQKRPVDVLEELLLVGDITRGEKHYGTEEVAAMCLQIATRPVDRNTMQLDPDVKGTVSRRTGVVSELRASKPLTQSSLQMSSSHTRVGALCTSRTRPIIASILTSPTTLLSPSTRVRQSTIRSAGSVFLELAERRNCPALLGLAKLTSRLLSPVLTSTFVQVDGTVQWSAEQLHSLASTLYRLTSYLNASEPRLAAVDQARQYEWGTTGKPTLTFKSLTDFIARAGECIGLLSLICEIRHWSTVKVALAGKFTSLRVGDLINGREGNAFLQEAIRVLATSKAGSGDKTASQFFGELKQRCPAIFFANEARITALRILTEASAPGIPVTEQYAAARRAIALLSQRPEALSPLGPVVNALVRLHAPSFAIKLALLHASEEREQNAEKGKQSDIDFVRRCHGQVFGVLDRFFVNNKDEDGKPGDIHAVIGQQAARCLVAAVNTLTSPYWHRELYKWLLEITKGDGDSRITSRCSEALVSITSPHIEEYLQARAPELHARWLERRGKSAEACLVLAGLAAAEDQSIPFVKRLDYLAAAFTKSQSALVPSSDLGRTSRDGVTPPPEEITADIRLRLEVGRRQADLIETLQVSLDSVGAGSPEGRKLQSHLDTLTSRLLDLNEMFNKVVAPLRLYDHAIILLHCSQSLSRGHAAHHSLITRLWIGLLQNPERFVEPTPGISMPLAAIASVLSRGLVVGDDGLHIPMLLLLAMTDDEDDGDGNLADQLRLIFSPASPLPTGPLDVPSVLPRILRGCTLALQTAVNKGSGLEEQIATMVREAPRMCVRAGDACRQLLELWSEAVRAEFFDASLVAAMRPSRIFQDVLDALRVHPEMTTSGELSRILSDLESLARMVE